MKALEREVYAFGPFRLNVGERQLLQDDRPIPLRAKLFDALVLLVRQRGHLIEKAELIQALWPDAIVEEANLPHTISMLRKALGESDSGPRYVETVPKRGYRFIAEVRELGEYSATARQLAEADEARSPTGKPALHPEIQFCTAPDHVRIAYATVGTGPVLLKTANWLNHLEFDWRSPIWRHLLEALARDHRLVRYDERGNGLSDWDARDISFEAFVRDLETVVDVLGLQRFALLGISQGCAVSIAYAVRHPQRVSHLILHGGYAKGWRVCGSPEMLRRGEALQTLTAVGWGRDSPAIRQLFTSLFVPDGTAEQMAWFNELQRVTASPENAVRIRDAFGDIDVSGILSQVRTPTLVLHSVREEMVPFSNGRDLASGIPGARLVPLESRNHLILEHEPAWPVFLDEVRRFLTRV